MTSLDIYRSQVERLGSDAFLGRLFWYGLSNVRLPHDEMIRMLHACSITRALPRVPEDVDVFKRVAKEAKRNKIPTTDPNKFENYLVRSFSDDKAVTRRIVVESVDNKGKHLDYTEQVDIVFDRHTQVVSVQQPDPMTRISPMAAELAQEICDGFIQWRNCLDLYGVRSWVRGRLLDMNATMVKSGVYFLAEENVDTLASIEAFGDLINHGDFGRVEFHSLPLLADEKQRDMIRRSFEAETAGAIDKMLTEIGDLSAGNDDVSIDKYSKIVTDYQQIVEKTKKYESLLEDSLAQTETRLKVFQKSLVNLRLKVKTS